MNKTEKPEKLTKWVDPQGNPVTEKQYKRMAYKLNGMGRSITEFLKKQGYKFKGDGGRGKL